MQQNQTITQKRLWYEKEFRLDDGILHLKEMGLFGGQELELRYEDILSQKRTKTQPNLLLLLGATFLMLLSVTNLAGWINNGTEGAAFWGVVFASGLFYMTYKSAGEMVCLETIHNRDIQFFRDPGSKRRTDRFIDELLKERKLFLVEKYWDCVDDYQLKIENLNWLKNANIVNINEFKYLKEEMFQTEETNQQRPIGFQRLHAA